jgi:hypothetical protein
MDGLFMFINEYPTASHEPAVRIWSAREATTSLLYGMELP